MRHCVWSRNLKNDEVMARVGPQHHRKKEVCNSNRISLLSYCRLSSAIVGLKIFSLPNFALKSPNRIFIWYSKNDRNPAVIPHTICLLNHLFSPQLGAYTFKIIILHQRPLRSIYDILSLTKSTLLTSDTVLCRTKNPVSNWWFSFPFS